MKDNLKGKFHLTASGHNSYEILDAGVECLNPIAKILIQVFLYKPDTSFIQGFDGNYIDFKKDNTRLTLGWDIWSGCFLMSYDNFGDREVEEIGNYISMNINTLTDL